MAHRPLGYTKVTLSNNAMDSDTEVAPILLTPQSNAQEVSDAKTKTGSPL